MGPSSGGHVQPTTATIVCGRGEGLLSVVGADRRPEVLGAQQVAPVSPWGECTWVSLLILGQSGVASGNLSRWHLQCPLML